MVLLHARSWNARLRGWTLVAVALVILVEVPAGAADIIQYTREDPDNGMYLVGRLAWNDAVGSIAWDEVLSEDPGGPGSDLRKDVYVSAPLPRAIHVNASRQIQLDLFQPGRTGTLGSSCRDRDDGRGLGAALWAGDRLLAGITPGWTGFRIAGTTPESQKHATQFPPDPPGYGVCRMRMAAEIGVLAEGTVLRLEIRRESSSVPATYGMGADHQSVLRIPFFSDDELPYRYPMFVRGAPPSPEQEGLTDGLLGLAGVAGMAMMLPFLRRRRDWTVAAALLVLLAGLAGCAGPGSKASGDSDGNSGVEAEQLSPDYREGNVSLGRGAIAGQVRSNDLGEAVGGAFVALLGTQLSTTTDSFGRFVFKDLAPSVYTVRVDRPGFRSYEGVVPVKANLIAKVEITLVRIESDPNLRPHLHDYWGPKEEVTVMDRVVLSPDATGDVCGLGFAKCQPRAVSFRIPPPAGLDYASVLPGTYEVNVTVEWDPARAGHDVMNLSYQANHDGAPDNYSYLLPRKSGEPFRIATTWEMQDSGHQRFSTWTFRLFTRDHDIEPGRGDYAAFFTVTVKLRKGVVPIEPAHRDFWNGKNEVTAVTETSKARGSSVPWNMAWIPDGFVPPGTEWIDVYLNASRPLFPEHDMEFRYKTANDGAPTIGCWQGYSAYSCDGPGYERIPIAAGSPTQHHFHLTLKPTEPDPFYAVRSFWVFAVQSGTENEDVALAHADYYANGSPLTFTLAVVAHRSPPS